MDTKGCRALTMARILFVDDEAFVLGVLANVVASAGHEAVTASRGDAAIDLFTAESYDLLISDLRMAPIDGMQVLAAARKVRPAMPVVILTAYASAETRTQAKNMGAFAYLTKPFNVQDLLDTIARALDSPPDGNSAGPATTDSGISLSM